MCVCVGCLDLSLSRALRCWPATRTIKKAPLELFGDLLPSLFPCLMRAENRHLDFPAPQIKCFTLFASRATYQPDTCKTGSNLLQSFIRDQCFTLSILACGLHFQIGQMKSCFPRRIKPWNRLVSRTNFTSGHYGAIFESAPFPLDYLHLNTVPFFARTTNCPSNWTTPAPRLVCMYVETILSAITLVHSLKWPKECCKRAGVCNVQPKVMMKRWNNKKI